MPTPKTIVLGVTGSIAAYKAADLAGLGTDSVRFIATGDDLRYVLEDGLILAAL